MKTYNDLLTNRRSIRDFKDEAVSDNLIQEILHETCMAPSASNQQPWRFIVIHDRALIKRLSDESKKNLVNLIVSNSDTVSSLRQYEKILRNSDFNVFYNAPCLVIICGKNNYRHFVADCSLAAAYFMFAATARGLGTCWIGLGEAIESSELKKTIGLPDDYQIVAPMILGYPKKIPASSSRIEPVILREIKI